MALGLLRLLHEWLLVKISAQMMIMCGRCCASTIVVSIIISDDIVMEVKNELNIAR